MHSMDFRVICFYIAITGFLIGFLNILMHHKAKKEIFSKDMTHNFVIVILAITLMATSKFLEF